MTLIELEKINESDLSYLGHYKDINDSLRFEFDEVNEYVPTNFSLIDNIRIHFIGVGTTFNSSSKLLFLCETVEDSKKLSDSLWKEFRCSYLKWFIYVGDKPT